ncbi:MAG: hypothetical protein JXA54_01980 [Candidatus Heimdallarchaeota archaeon]|nr:hypothetical protein [Candidatus Heimdallarchaeota archaeon]
MRVKQLSIIFMVMIMLSPTLSVIGFTQPINPAFTPQTIFEGELGIEAGQTLYYDIVQLNHEYFSSSSFSVPNLASNTLYVKIMSIYNVYFGDSDYGDIVNYGLGFMFEEDTIFSIGEGLLATNIIVPATAATPSVGLYGIPHFNLTYGPFPMLFALNDAWSIHAQIFTLMGLTVTNTVESLTAIYASGDSKLEFAYRKSDGICTHLLLEEVNLWGLNFTDGAFEINFNRVAMRELPMNIADNIAYTVDTFNLELSGSGELYSEINQTIVTSVIDQFEALEGVTIFKVVVEDIIGVYYLCSYYYYDMDDEILYKSLNKVVFNGFAGCYQSSPPPYYISSPILASKSNTPIFDGFELKESYTFIGGLAHWITPDWDIYDGQMLLYNTLMSVYIDDLLDLISPNTEEYTYNTFGGNFELIEKKGFYYFYEAFEYDMVENLDYSTLITIGLNNVYDEELNIRISEEGYICYNGDGTAAAVKIKGAYTYAYSNISPASDDDTGSIRVNFNIKLRNHEYDPPEIVKDGLLPGFNWFLAIPALLSIVAISLVIRRKR